MREAPFENGTRGEREKGASNTAVSTNVRTMIPEVIAVVRQRARRDVNNDDYDESTDSWGP